MCNQFPTISGFILLLMLCSCRENETGVPELPVTMDDSSRVIIGRAIGYASDTSVWERKKTLSFDKKSISYDSTGKVTREIDQHFDYMLKPQFRAKVTYMLHDTAITLIHDGQRARKLYNGNVSDEQKDIDGAWNSSFGSQYVMCIPHKLKDPGTIAEYVGMVTLVDSVDAQVVKVSYMKGAGSNPDHIWYYYFEPGTGKLLANSLKGKNNYWDYTRYVEFEKADGLLMPGVRRGYTADTLNNPGRLISESKHMNISFHEDFPEDHFNIPDGK